METRQSAVARTARHDGYWWGIRLIVSAQESSPDDGARASQLEIPAVHDFGHRLDVCPSCAKDGGLHVDRRDLRHSVEMIANQLKLDEGQAQRRSPLPIDGGDTAKRVAVGRADLPEE